MASGSEDTHHNLALNVSQQANQQRQIPIHPSSATPSSPREYSMDVTISPTPLMAPPAQNNQEGAHNPSSVGGVGETGTIGASVASAGIAASSHQPKVQTAFIHKLYNMLEDQSIRHLIAWSSSNESFLISPSNEFSKALASYFKHTNTSSFVRQLNMYGFHKVSDVFQTGSPETPLWEFKHGNGNFKRGDLGGLREIKRRASRVALPHRDSFTSGSKIATSQIISPPEAVPDSLDMRMNMLEHSLYDMHARLARTEDAYAFMTSKCQSLSDGLVKCYQYNQDISSLLRTLVPNPDHQIHHNVSIMQQDIGRQLENLRNLDYNAQLDNRNAYLSNSHIDHNTSLSPSQTPQDDSRRGSLLGDRRPSLFHSVAPHHLVPSPQRYTSISTVDVPPSLRGQGPSDLPPPAAPPFPQQQYPLASASTDLSASFLGRRHTSADVHSQIWRPNEPTTLANKHSPFTSGYSSVQWPSSPHQTPLPGLGDQQLRDTLARYQLSGSARSLPSLSHRSSGQHIHAQGSRHHSPPAHSGTETPSGAGRTHTTSPENGWSLPSARIPLKDVFKGTGVGSDMFGSSSGPPTRRSSMASNVHNLLNPAETAETDEEDRGDGPGVDELRKRRRVA